MILFLILIVLWVASLVFTWKWAYSVGESDGMEYGVDNPMEAKIKLGRYYL
jgi:hypothetical protein